VDILLSDSQTQDLLTMLGFAPDAQIVDAWFVQEINGVKLSVSGKKLRASEHDVTRQ